MTEREAQEGVEEEQQERPLAEAEGMAAAESDSLPQVVRPRPVGQQPTEVTVTSLVSEHVA